MNKLIIPLIALLLAAACKKTGTGTGNTVIYEETIPGIYKNEPVLLTFNGNGTDKVIWTVMPSTNIKISTVGNTATIVFGAAGTYTVTATAGDVSAKYTVIVNNTEYNPYGTAFNLSAAKSVNINQTEPVVFTVRNAKAGSHVTWSVYSRAFSIIIDSANNTAAITFTGGGFGAVTATDGINTQRRTVWVNDVANVNADEDTVSFILGEKLQLTPSIQTVGGVKQLMIKATTFNSYHCATDKILSFSLNDDYMIDYSGVAMSSQVCTTPGVASCSNSFNNVAVGNHSFTVNFENKTYTGSFNVSSAGVDSFSWGDASVVSISPLSVQ